MSASDDDEYQRDADSHEEDEESERSRGTDEENDEDEHPASELPVVDARFIERIPEKKPRVSVLSARLPRCLVASADEDTSTVELQVRLTRPAHPFEKVCRKALDEMRCGNVLRQLGQQDVDALRAFVEHEHTKRRQREENGLTVDDQLAEGIAPAALEEMEEMLEGMRRASAGLATKSAPVLLTETGEDTDHAPPPADEDDNGSHSPSAGEDDTAEAERAPLFWLEPLLANDVPTLERTLAAMYGWAVPPPPPPRPPRTVSFAAGAPGSSNSGDRAFTGDDDDDEDGEEVVVPDPARARPSWFKASGAFGAEAHNESGQDESTHDNGEETTTTTVTAMAEANLSEEGDHVPEAEATSGGAGADQPVAGTDSASQRPSAPQRAPLTAVPAFAEVNRPLWIVFDKNEEEWHLLDEHPVLRTLRARTQRAVRRQGGADGQEDGEEEEEEQGEEMEETAEVIDEKGQYGDDAEEDGARHGEQAGVPDYDLDTMLPVDGLVLSALFCPAALRLCLLQRRRPSLTCVEQWLRRDLATGFPLLATVHAAIVASHTVDASGLPYPLPSLSLDFNIFLEEPFLTDATVPASEPLAPRPPRPSSGKERPYLLSPVSLASSPYAKHLLCQERQVSLISSSLSHTGRLIMERLLAAGVFPSHPVRLEVFETCEGVRLALWLLMSMPRSVLTRWGFGTELTASAAGELTEDTAAARRAAAEEADWYANGADEEDNEEDNEEDEEGSELSPNEATVESTREYIRRLRQRETRERRVREGPRLRLAPFSMALLLELRRRVARAMKTKPPSHLSLHAALERSYRAVRIEDGKARGDPLLTSRFLLAMPEPVVDSPATTAGTGQDDAPEAATPAPRFRHQRLYQSDLMLLLLALTSTPQPRGAVAAGVAKGVPVPKSATDIVQSIRGGRLSVEVLAASGHSTAVTLSKFAANGQNTSMLSLPEQPPTVSLRRRSQVLLQGSPSDAHESFFRELVALKMDKASATPLTLLRSGTWRLLLTALPRFREPRLMQTLCEAVPLYQVLGEVETCPLPVLIDAWSTETAKALKLELVAGMVQNRYLDVFANRFWHELHCRVAGGLYGAARVAYMTRQLTVLFDRVDERLRQYQDAVSTLGGVVHLGRATYPTAGVANSSISSHKNVNATGGSGGAWAGSTGLGVSGVLYDGRRLHGGVAAGAASARRFTSHSMSVLSSSRSLVGALPEPTPAVGSARTPAGPAMGSRKSLSRSSLRTTPGAAPHDAVSQGTSPATLALTAGAASVALPRAPGVANTTAATAAASATAANTGAQQTKSAVSGRHLGVYDAEFKRELTRVRAVFDGLPMSPSTYITPYTLFALLFGDTEDDARAGAPMALATGKTSGQRSIDVAAVYYVVVMQGITTVRTDPFFGPEMPALEYAVRELDLTAARALVQMGASLEDLIEGGTMTVEQYCELMLSPEETEELRRAADLYTQFVTTNPDAHYGILRCSGGAAAGM